MLGDTGNKREVRILLECILVNISYRTFFYRDHFYQFGEIRSITMVSRQQCAFVQFTTRTSAENAAEKSFNKLIMQVRVLLEFFCYQCAVK